MKALQTLNQKEISRKEFLIILGLGLLSVFGIGPILRLLTGKNPSDHLSRNTSSGDYGKR